MSHFTNDVDIAVAFAKIDPDLKAKWVAALRSGKYRQGKRLLATLKNKRYSYCCLGVLCNLDTETKKRRMNYPGENSGDLAMFITGDTSGEAYLPEDLADRVGLPQFVQTQLATMNDEGRSFAYIADWIEENL